MTASPGTGIDLGFSEPELEAVRGEIVGFIEAQVATAGADGGVIGLSGGVDSTLTATLAAEALGADGLYGLVMPSAVNVDEHMSDAERVAEGLGIDYGVVGIEPIAEAVLGAVPIEPVDAEAVEAEPLRTAYGNLRARLRAVASYFTANYENRLVIGTGNRTEALVGYFTKYGDGAVDCHPIGGLYKAQVRQLARHVGVDEAIVSRAPTAGLWAGQTDEAELGLDYDRLDAILALSVDGPLSPAATAELVDGVDRADVERVHGMVEASAHKRRVPPSPGPHSAPGDR